MTANLDNPIKRDVDLTNLHPVFRAAAQNVLADLAAASIPLRIFEGFRSPLRQSELYAQGRTKPGKKVTFADAWSSYHNYGAAADFVVFVNNQWTWDEPAAGMWDALHKIGKSHGVMHLDFETPHLQLAGTSSSALRDGHYPEGGDESWAENLAQAILTWKGSAEAPPLPQIANKMPVG